MAVEHCRHYVYPRDWPFEHEVAFEDGRRLGYAERAGDSFWVGLIFGLSMAGSAWLFDWLLAWLAS